MTAARRGDEVKLGALGAEDLATNAGPASLGLVERANLYGCGERTSHLRLTDAGERIARQLVEMETTR